MKNIPNLLNDRKGKINIDFKHLSNRASLMGNPVLCHAQKTSYFAWIIYSNSITINGEIARWEKCIF